MPRVAGAVPTRDPRDVPSCADSADASRSVYRPLSRVCEMKISPVSFIDSRSRSFKTSASSRPSPRAKADDAERHRCETLELGTRVDPRREEPRAACARPAALAARWRRSGASPSRASAPGIDARAECRCPSGSAPAPTSTVFRYSGVNANAARRSPCARSRERIDRTA